MIMGRIARTALLYNGCYAHVFSRSISRQKIFQGEEDFLYFKSMLLAVKEKARFLVHHYCLMQTHFHLAVTINEVSQFSTALKELKRNYTYWFNEKYNHRGPLWRERFKSILIEDERYLQACGTYIEYNPIKAGIVSSVEDWPYSSARFYLRNKNDNLVDGYERLSLPKDIDLTDDDSFIRGCGIGTGLFKRLLRDNVGLR